MKIAVSSGTSHLDTWHFTDQIPILRYREVPNYGDTNGPTCPEKELVVCRNSHALISLKNVCEQTNQPDLLDTRRLRVIFQQLVSYLSYFVTRSSHNHNLQEMENSKCLKGSPIMPKQVARYHPVGAITPAWTPPTAPDMWHEPWRPSIYLHFTRIT